MKNFILRSVFGQLMRFSQIVIKYFQQCFTFHSENIIIILLKLDLIAIARKVLRIVFTWKFFREKKIFQTCWRKGFKKCFYLNVVSREKIVQKCWRKSWMRSLMQTGEIQQNPNGNFWKMVFFKCNKHKRGYLLSPIFTTLSKIYQNLRVPRPPWYFESIAHLEWGWCVSEAIILLSSSRNAQWLGTF